jgi:hypothetical protein
MHDAMVRRYDELHARGGFTRARLALKVARDPFDPTTERQLLLVLGVVIAFAVMSKKGPGTRVRPGPSTSDR